MAMIALTAVSGNTERRGGGNRLMPRPSWRYFHRREERSAYGQFIKSHAIINGARPSPRDRFAALRRASPRFAALFTNTLDNSATVV